MWEIHFAFKDWLYSLTIGFLVVSYWRGTWTLIDILGCDQPEDATLANGKTFCFAAAAAEDPAGDQAIRRLHNAKLSYAIGVCLLIIGVVLVWMGMWLPNRKTFHITTRLGMTRFIIVYILGASAINLWRGIWYWTDHWILPSDPLLSFWTTSLAGAGFAYGLSCGNSLLAPPAIFLLDGPDTDPPPIAVTALGSHFSITLPVNEKHPDSPIYIHMLDLIISFGVLPFAVVWYWRGTWLLLDHYLWGFIASNRDVQLSILWSMLLFGVCIWLTSEPVVGIVDRRIPQQNPFLMGMLGRLRTYVLAWGTVSLWRCFWLFWDEFLGGSTLLSACLGHVLPLLILTALGCVSSINAPASTLGVDSIPHPKCEDEPLFSLVPIPWETLYAFGMFRQIQKARIDDMKRNETKSPMSVETPAEVHSPEIEFASITKKQSSESEEEIIFEGKSQANEDSEDQEQDASQIFGSQEEQGSSLRAQLIQGWKSSELLRTGSCRKLKPNGLRPCQCSEYSQRPHADNERYRSRFFRSR